MRIISGFFKGKKILQPKDTNTRPLKDLTKESIFNILLHSKKFKINFHNSLVLDLFSGVGSFGIECLSRGVKKVIFVENYIGVIPILKKNLLSLNSIKNYEVKEYNIEVHDLDFEIKFDIIFLDPPYKNKNILDILLKIKNKNLLNENGVIILHRHKNENDIFLDNFRIIEEKKYGISKIIFLN